MTFHALRVTKYNSPSEPDLLLAVLSSCLNFKLFEKLGVRSAISHLSASIQNDDVR